MTHLSSEQNLVGIRGCEDLAAAQFDEAFAARLAWEGLCGSGSFVEGAFNFADDKPDEPPATLKIVAERFMAHPFWGQLLLGAYAAYPCVQSADVLTYVPDGPRDFTQALGDRLHKPVAFTKRALGGSRHDFKFESDADQELALSADNIFQVEDVLTTGSSSAAMRLHLRREQNVHTLAIILRGRLKPEYSKNMTVHYLMERAIPRRADVFCQQFGIEPNRESQA